MLLAPKVITEIRRTMPHERVYPGVDGSAFDSPADSARFSRCRSEIVGETFISPQHLPTKPACVLRIYMVLRIPGGDDRRLSGAKTFMTLAEEIRHRRLMETAVEI